MHYRAVAYKVYEMFLLCLQITTPMYFTNLKVYNHSIFYSTLT